MNRLVMILGAGDIATGIACRLVRCGFPVAMTELARPVAVRRTVSFAQAVYDGRTTVEGITAVRVVPAAAAAAVRDGLVPVIIDPERTSIAALRPWAVVDAILAKRNIGTSLGLAPIVIGVGPGFTPGRDVHAVVETMRGHHLGRVLTDQPAEPNTGIPGNIGGYTVERVLRAPAPGCFQSQRKIGDHVSAGEVVAEVSGAPVVAAISGILRGLLQDGLDVPAGMKVGDIDPRALREHCYTVSDKARAVAGGVLEALLQRETALHSARPALVTCVG